MACISVSYFTQPQSIKSADNLKERNYTRNCVFVFTDKWLVLDCDTVYLHNKNCNIDNLFFLFCSSIHKSLWVYRSNIWPAAGSGELIVVFGANPFGFALIDTVAAAASPRLLGIIWT